MLPHNNLDHLIEQVTKAYFHAYGNNLIKVVLYGDYARGRYHPSSDIELIALVQGNRTVLGDRLELVSNFANDLGALYDVHISTAVISNEDFMKKKNASIYYHNIEEIGKVIYSYSPKIIFKNFGMKMLLPLT